MLSTKSVLKYEKENRSYSLIVCPDAPLAHVLEALETFKVYCQRIVESAQAKADEVAPVVEEPSTEQTL